MTREMGLRDPIPQEGCRTIGAQNVIIENTPVGVSITMKTVEKALRDESYLDYSL
jgi:hypothetical protein